MCGGGAARVGGACVSACGGGASHCCHSARALLDTPPDCRSPPPISLPLGAPHVDPREYLAATPSTPPTHLLDTRMLTCACVCVCVYVCMCVYVYVYVCVCVCMYVYVCAWMQWKVWQCVDGVQYERCAVRGDGACLWHSLGVLLCGSAAAGERMRQQVCAFGMAMSDAAVDMHPLLVVEDELLVELGVADGGAIDRKSVV